VTEVEEWLLVALVDRILNLLVEFAAGLVRKRNLDFLGSALELSDDCSIGRRTDEAAKNGNFPGLDVLALD